VKGGPLQNEFILTQAPLQHTIADFWRMVSSKLLESGIHNELFIKSLNDLQTSGPFFIININIIHYVMKLFQVWQERSEFIYQLCECTISPAESNGPPGTILDQLSKTHSPFYWPR
jgi:hypothetical protein